MVNQKISAGLDQQQNRNELLAAQGEQRKQAVIERREENDLKGLGNAYSVANQNQQAGIDQIIGGVASGASAYAGAQGANIDGSASYVPPDFNSMANRNYGVTY